MTYKLIFSPRALDDLAYIKKSGNKTLLRKLQKILIELTEHPYEGTGKPERLKYRDNTYSRRLSQKDRVVYSVREQMIEVNILQMSGHYNDK